MIYPFRHNKGTIIERFAFEVQRRLSDIVNGFIESFYERYRIGRGFGDAVVPDHQGGFQAVAPDLRQANDLLSAVGSDAGRNPGDPGDLHPL